MLNRACISNDMNGLDLAKLREAVAKRNTQIPADMMSDEALFDYACRHLCLADKYIGADDIIADIDVHPPHNGSSFTYKGDIIQPVISQLAMGQYGILHKHTFVHEGQTLYFAVKRGLHETKLEEASVIADHTASVSCPGVISMKLLNYRNEDIVIMPLADGDLARYCGRIGPKQADQIVEIIGDALLCLFENGDYYYDIKPHNILFTCHDGGLASIFLGDMGSIIPQEGDFISSYSPLDHLDDGFVSEKTTTETTYKHYTYMLACLYCMLITRTSPPQFGDDLETAKYKLFQLAAETEDLIEGSNKYTLLLQKIVQKLEDTGCEDPEAYLSVVPTLPEFL